MHSVRGYRSRHYRAFAAISEPYIGARATTHSYRARIAGFSAGLVVGLFAALLLLSGGHGGLARVAVGLYLVAGVLVVVMIVEFWMMARAATRHLGVKFRFLDQKELRSGRFDAWLAKQREELRHSRH